MCTVYMAVAVAANNSSQGRAPALWERRSCWGNAWRRTRLAAARGGKRGVAATIAARASHGGRQPNGHACQLAVQQLHPHSLTTAAADAPPARVAPPPPLPPPPARPPQRPLKPLTLASAAPPPPSGQSRAHLNCAREHNPRPPYPLPQTPNRGLFYPAPPQEFPPPRQTCC